MSKILKTAKHFFHNMSTKIWTNSPHHWLPSFLFTFPTQTDNRSFQLTHGVFTVPSFPPELWYPEHFNVSYLRYHLSSSPSDFTTTTQCFLPPQPDFCSVMFLWDSHIRWRHIFLFLVYLRLQWCSKAFLFECGWLQANRWHWQLLTCSCKLWCVFVW